MVGLSGLPPAEVVQRSAEGVTWVFDGGILHTLEPGEVSPPPLVSRGRSRIEGLGEVYLAYFAGPPEPRYLALSGIALSDPQEFRLAALYFEHLLAALAAAGYRKELARQARTDWLTGLSNRRSLARQLARTPKEDAAVGLLEAHPETARTQAEHDMFQKKLAERVRRQLPKAGCAFRIGAFRVALLLPEAAALGLEQALTRELEQGLEADLPEPRPTAHNSFEHHETQPGEAEQGEAKTRQAKPNFAFGWAYQQVVRAKRVAELFDAAEAGLEATLAARPGAAPPASSLGVRVHSGLEQVRRAVQERLRALPGTFPLDDEVELVFDTPTGFALEVLSGGLKPRRTHTLVVTSSTSPPYLRDLLAEHPQGLIVGSPDDERLAAALVSLEDGPFYDGPPLEDDDLYPREREVWRLVVRGLSNAQIAEALEIREKTVANYVTNLQDKLFLNNRVELVLYYLGKLERP